MVVIDSEPRKARWRASPAPRHLSNPGEARQLYAGDKRLRGDVRGQSHFRGETGLLKGRASSAAKIGTVPRARHLDARRIGQMRKGGTMQDHGEPLPEG